MRRGPPRRRIGWCNAGVTKRAAVYQTRRGPLQDRLNGRLGRHQGSVADNSASIILIFRAPHDGMVLPERESRSWRDLTTANIGSRTASSSEKTQICCYQPCPILSAFCHATEPP